MCLLGELITEVSKRNKSNRAIPVYSVTNSGGFVRDYFSKDVSSRDKKAYKIVERFDFAFNPSRINVGSIDCLTVANEAVVSPIYTVFSCKPSISPLYLNYFLKSQYVHDYINSVTSGSVRAILKLDALKALDIDLPPLEVQKERVSKLEDIKKLEKLAVDEAFSYDELIKSRFNEMFSKSNLIPLSEYIKELRAGKSLAGTKPCPNKVLKTGAATFGFFDSNQYKFLPADYVPNPKHKVEKGDVIISRMNTPELVGTCSYVWDVPDNYYYPDRLWKTIVKPNVEPIFIWQCLQQKSAREQIKSKASGTSGTMFNISKLHMLSTEIPFADCRSQSAFASFVRQIDKLKFNAQERIKLYQELLNKKMDEYFG